MVDECDRADRSFLFKRFPKKVEKISPDLVMKSGNISIQLIFSTRGNKILKFYKLLVETGSAIALFTPPIELILRTAIDELIIDPTIERFERLFGGPSIGAGSQLDPTARSPHRPHDITPFKGGNDRRIGARAFANIDGAADFFGNQEGADCVVCGFFLEIGVSIVGDRGSDRTS